MQGNGYIKYYLDSSGLIWNFDVDITKPWFRSWTVFSLLESIMGKTTFAELALSLSLLLSDSETKRSKEKRIPLRRKWSLMNIEDGNFLLSKKNPDVRQQKLKLSEILTILMKSEIGLYITVSEKNKKKIGLYITVSASPAVFLFRWFKKELRTPLPPVWKSSLLLFLFQKKLIVSSWYNSDFTIARSLGARGSWCCYQEWQKLGREH